MRFALILAFLSSVLVTTEVEARPKGGKHHSTRATKSKSAAKTAKRSHRAKAKSAQVAVADTDEEVSAGDSDETPSMPASRAATSAPVSHNPVAQASDDEEPPARKKR